MVKFLIFILLGVGVIVALLYIGQILFNKSTDTNPTTKNSTLEDLKSEVNETASKFKETKSKVESVSKEINDIKENLQNS
jgi:peptidoglycan hydrolase CwlO-like protein